MRRNALPMMIFALAGAIWGTQASASTLVMGTGWIDDTIRSVEFPSDGSPVTFNLTKSGVFSLSDGYISGDIFTISGSFAGVSTFTTPSIAIPLGLGDTYFDGTFYDNSYSHFQAALSAGTYTISISGDGAGGVPAGFAYRLDVSSVPLPASAPLFGAGLLALGAAGYLAKRKREIAAA